MPTHFVESHSTVINSFLIQCRILYFSAITKYNITSNFNALGLICSLVELKNSCCKSILMSRDHNDLQLITHIDGHAFGEKYS